MIVSLFALLFLLLLLTVLFEPSSLSFIILLVLTFSFLCVHYFLCSYSHSLVCSLCFFLFVLVVTFLSTTSLLIFFITYEFSLFPVLLLLLLFGSQPEKLQASAFLILYTVVCSTPLFLLALTTISSVSISFSGLSSYSSFLVCLSFMVKSPMYTLHSWLPKAHVEAPLYGSILLAGVILKLGGYGLLLLSPCLFQCCGIYFYLTLSGGVVCSVLCCRCWDMKSIVAYSSVVHMGSVTLGALSGTELGFRVSCGAIVGHTLLSPLLFVLAFEVYASTGSRCFVHGHSSSLAGGLLLLISVCFGLNFGLPPFLLF